ncbi:MAG: O-antigen ligase family protein [Bacteroidia bacterium]|nr:O-antigen ligase family protein [Bacteroidia bacterium]
MKLVKYITLSFILLNIPSVVLIAFGESLGSLFSYITILLLVIFYFLEKKTSPNWWMLSIALTYFLISSFQYYGETKYFIMDFIKYTILIICGYELTKRVTNTELFYYVLIGALSVGFEAIFMTSNFGRYAGLYFNANVAGFICIFGYALTYGLKSNVLTLLGQFLFTLMGLLTFSRTFIVIWVLLNIVSLKISFRNLRILGVGILIFSTLLFIDEVVGLNNPRFDQLKNIINNENVSTEEISQDSRIDTWAIYYDKIFDAPFIGNGYKSFTGGLNSTGVHNSYLVILGEAGIIPFALFIALIIYFYYWSIFFFRTSPNLIMQTISLSLFLMANHNFFNFYFVTLAAMWIQYQIYKLNREEQGEEKYLNL